MCERAAGWARGAWRARGAALGLLVLALGALPLSGQQSLDESRRRLEEIRRERQRLEEERLRLQSQVHDLNEELDNLERQRRTTNQIVNELETQIGGLNSNIDRASADLALAQDNLAEKRAVTARRLVEIYKRGELYTFEVLVAAQSFGDLLSRYKYLFLQSRQDQALVTDVEKLTRQVERRRREILDVKSELDSRREEREAELRRYGQLVQEGSQRLRETRRSARTTEQRLSALEQDEARLNSLLADLEARARARGTTRAAPGAPAAGNLTTADIGKLDWPVEGPILKRYGPERLESGVTIRHNGMYIGAPAGTPVKAVEAGTVELVQTLGTYGLAVIVAHGNGYRSLYMRLSEAAVTVGSAVTKGQVIGRVGGDNTAEGAHLYFEIRGENGIALDPADWLKRRR
jgi:septal ring factor EnvC (AmiA/AmiB activator)